MTEETSSSLGTAGALVSSETAVPPSAKSAGGFSWGTGRRKTAVARVRVREGRGLFLVNGKEMPVFFCNAQDQLQVMAPLKSAQSEGKLDIYARVSGGGPTGQAGAVRMGLARALCAVDSNLEPAMREGSHLTRDSRMKERKKYGQRGARRRFQFSKR